MLNQCAVQSCSPLPAQSGLLKSSGPCFPVGRRRVPVPSAIPAACPVIPIRAGRFMSLRSVECDSVEWHPPPGRIAPVLGGRCEAGLRSLRSGRPFVTGFDVMACHRLFSLSVPSSQHSSFMVLPPDIELHRFHRRHSLYVRVGRAEDPVGEARAVRPEQTNRGATLVCGVTPRWGNQAKRRARKASAAPPGHAGREPLSHCQRSRGWLAARHPAGHTQGRPCIRLSGWPARPASQAGRRPDRRVRYSHSQQTNRDPC